MRDWHENLGTGRKRGLRQGCLGGNGHRSSTLNGMRSKIAKRNVITFVLFGFFLSLLFVFFLWSSRAKRSPKQRRRHQINGSPIDAEKDRLITTDSDGTYKRPPGVNNSAYIVCMSLEWQECSDNCSDSSDVRRFLVFWLWSTWLVFHM